MFGKFTSVLGLAAVIGAGTTYAGTSQTTSGGWSRETRQLGNKVTIDVYRRAPYALTGDTQERETGKSPGRWTRETRQLGNKVTIDVYRR